MVLQATANGRPLSGRSLRAATKLAGSRIPGASVLPWFRWLFAPTWASHRVTLDRRQSTAPRGRAEEATAAWGAVPQRPASIPGLPGAPVETPRGWANRALQPTAQKPGGG